MAEEKKEQKALTAAIEAMKVTLALATGTLVFSAGLLKEKLNIGCGSKWLLIVSWGLLAVSILSGILVHLRAPVMIHEDRPDIKDKYFEIPGMIHHVAFVGGVICLGIAMALILFSS